MTFSYSNNQGVWTNYVFYAPMFEKKRGTKVKCSGYEVVVSGISELPNEKLVAPLTNDYIYIRDDNYTDKDTFKTANANTVLLYELAEPFTVPLPDGQPIKSFAGINNIYADTGDTSLQFRKIG